MKKLVNIVLLITFCGVVAIPREAKATSASAENEGARMAVLNVLTVGALALGVWWLITSRSQKRTEKADETKVAEDFRFIPENRDHRFESSLKENHEQPMLLYSVRLELP